MRRLPAGPAGHEPNPGVDRSKIKIPETESNRNQGRIPTGIQGCAQDVIKRATPNLDKNLPVVQKMSHFVVRGQGNQGAPECVPGTRGSGDWMREPRRDITRYRRLGRPEPGRAVGSAFNSIGAQDGRGPAGSRVPEHIHNAAVDEQVREAREHREDPAVARVLTGCNQKGPDSNGTLIRTAQKNHEEQHTHEARTRKGNATALGRIQMFRAGDASVATG